MRVNKRGLGEKTGPILRDSFLAIFFVVHLRNFFYLCFHPYLFYRLELSEKNLKIAELLDYFFFKCYGCLTFHVKELKELRLRIICQSELEVTMSLNIHIIFL